MARRGLAVAVTMATASLAKAVAVKRSDDGLAVAVAAVVAVKMMRRPATLGCSLLSPKADQKMMRRN